MWPKLADRDQSWRRIRTTMLATWQLEQKVAVWGEKTRIEHAGGNFFSHWVCVLVVLIIMEYFSRQNPLVRVSWQVLSQLSVQRNSVGMKWIVQCSPPPPTPLIFLPMDLNHWQKQEGNIAEESYGPIISHWLSSGLKSGHTQDTLIWPRNVGWLNRNN